jgi:adenosylcobinamide-GDP ribazoletransferase
MGFFAALRFLTILPAPSSKGEVPGMIGRTIPYFPAVGLIIGIILTSLYYVLHLVFPLPVVGALLVAYLAIVTGGHHLDGLIDTCDALVAGRTREQRLNIMSDTRVGAFGITGVCILLLVKYAALSGTNSLAPLILFPVMSRWALTGIILIFPSARTQGMGADTKGSAGWAGFLWATIVCLIINVAFAGLIEGPTLMLVLFALIWCLGLFLSHLFGGLTGDCYGALVEAGEVLSLLLLIAATPFMQPFPANGLLGLPLLKG